MQCPDVKVTILQNPYVVQPKSQRDTISTKFEHGRTTDLLQFANKVVADSSSSPASALCSFLWNVVINCLCNATESIIVYLFGGFSEN
jgi:hypothetical protein